MTSHAPLPSNRKILKNNTKIVDLGRGDFQILARVVSDCLMYTASFRPEEMTAQVMRNTFEPLYTRLQRYAELAFQREFDTILMFGVKVEEIDLISGTIAISFVHNIARNNTRYKITFRNYMAPYATEWSNLLRKHGTAGVEDQYELV